ncbi:MAG: RelA/SpoT family protein [Bdellovibrionales bacterium]
MSEDVHQSELEVTTIEELVELTKKYLPSEEAEKLFEVYEFSKKAHEGQIRRSGEPYISHPLAVAGIIAQVQLDFPSVATGLLHDTVEDTEVELSDIQEKFGEQVAFLVDGVTKISQMNFKNTHEKQGENIRKMIVSMGRDVRVVLVKLCDRLHNMRTLKHMKPVKQEKIATETLDIYAPLASRLGINWLKIELEDLSFRYSNPEAFYSLVQKVQKKKKEREKFIEDFRRLLSKKISASFKNKFEIQGRPKHLYSIHKKMLTGLEYEQIYDVLAFRVVVSSIPECYEILGLVHLHWKPVPGRFKDFIAMPKNNNYQSLHTTVIGPGGDRVEVQIRTEEMHLVAEQGIAAHWSYKQGGADEEVIEKFNWLRDLVSMHQQVEDSGEFLESVKTNLFDTEIYVFTPKGDVREFPDGATPIDFAYSVHTDVGMRCTGARVNGKLVPLKYQLKNGDYIEIITSKTQTPSKDWLNYCVTTKARNKIRHYIKEEQRKRALEIGRGILEKAFRKIGLNPVTYFKKNTTAFEEALKEFGAGTLDELNILLGYGKIYPNQVIEKLFPKDEAPKELPEEGFISKTVKNVLGKNKKSSLVMVDGMSDVLVYFAKCCHPIPGDDITGFISRGRGITVHRADCPKSFELDPQREVDVQWGKTQDGAARLVKLYVLASDNRGLLIKMTEIFASKGIDLQNAQIKATRDRKVIAYFDALVKDSSQLQVLIADLRKLNDIIEVKRI